MLNNEIPEVNISISAYSFKLFEKEVYLILSSDYIESFNRFFNLLNKKVNIEEAKKYFVDDYVKMTNGNRAMNITADYNFIIKNVLGIKETMDKVEEFYRITIRDNKIDEITNE